MASSYTLASSRFPDGTTVYANPVRNRGVAPVSAVVASGSATFTGLLEFEDYIAHATVGGAYTEARFRTDGGSAGSTFAANETLNLSANNPAGTISRLVAFTMPSIFERPWISWIDEASRHRLALGFHRWDISDAAFHDRFEIKSSADPAGAQPSDMRTRFAIGTDGDRTAVIFNFTTGIEINSGDAAAFTSFGFTWKSPDTGAVSRTIGTLKSQIDASDNSVMEIDAVTAANNKGSTIKIGRQTNTSSSARKIEIKKMDGTNTDQFVINCAVGAIDLVSLAADPAAPAAGYVRFYAKSNALFQQNSSAVVAAL